MMTPETIRLNRRGVVVIPARLRKEYGLEEGCLLIAEARPEGILLRPAKAVPVEVYDSRRRAEFILNNAVDADDYARARKLVESMGLDPDQIPHERPDSE
jgi:bifunctional DNA-binding transcriptional regulator/antitoxin component of YhaV-PrlF toxin-antitoxin module